MSNLNPFPDKFDALSKNGAGIIAQHIMMVWARRGYRNVMARRYEVSEGTWGVQSNLVGGLPPTKKWLR